MKKAFLFLSLTLLISYTEAMCQCTTVLSKSGNAHWRAAEVLMGMASSADDYEQVAIELKQVVESDPNYAPVYMKLGKLYTQIGNDKGEAAFEWAEYYYDRCQEVCPDSTDAVVVEMAILNALRSRLTNGPNKFVGTWGIWSDYTGMFYPYVEISILSQKLSFKIVGDGEMREKIIEKNESATEIEYTHEVVFDKQPELRKKGFTHYYDERNNNADPGYPTTGNYKYDKEIVRYTESISIVGDKVIHKSLGMHTDYYFNGEKTYADNDNMGWTHELVKYNPPRQRGDKGRMAEAIDLGLSVKWASWNIGASRPEEHGARFSWGETFEKDTYGSLPSGESTNSIADQDIGNIICGTQYDAAHVLWGKGWRLPSNEEVDELINGCTRVFVKMNGEIGWKFTGPNGNSIFLPCAGYKDDSYYYWTGTRGTPFYMTAFSFGFDRYNNNELKRIMSSIDMGLVIRPVMDK